MVVANKCEMAPPACSKGILSVLLGHGDGTFDAPVLYPANGGHDNPIKVADVNHDGKLDLLVGACYFGNCISGSVGVLLGNGDGTFQPEVGYRVGGGSAVVAMTLAGLNGDGNTDVLTLVCDQSQRNCGTHPELFPLLGNANGTLSYPAPRFYAAGGTVYNPFAGMVAGDFNSDGKPDVAVGGRLFIRASQHFASSDYDHASLQLKSFARESVGKVHGDDHRTVRGEDDGYGHVPAREHRAGYSGCRGREGDAYPCFYQDRNIPDQSAVLRGLQ